MRRLTYVVLLTSLAVVFAACQGGPAPGSASPADRGKYLTTAMGCNDCHTPLKMGANGPEPDMAHQLAGHLEFLGTPPPPSLPPGPWNIAGMGTMTAWAGPWGVSYVANITPDEETGVGTWDENTFVRAMRGGKLQGGGRPLLPPMPWMWVNQLSDDDLKAMFAYLKTVPPVKNHVPAPVLAPPPAQPAQTI